MNDARTQHAPAAHPRRASYAHRPVTVALAGAGRRASLYGRYALAKPGRMKVVAVAEPNESRRNNLADLFGVSPDMRFASFEDLAARPGVAEAVINTSPDRLHYESSMALLSAGYHLLLEKPVALELRHVRGLIAEVARRRECGSPPCQVVMVRHVLRYEPLYREVKDLIGSGRIGRVTSLRTAQHVAYHRLATLFIRQPRYVAPAAAPLLLDEGCHDLDLIAWLLADHAARPRVAQVAGFAAPSQFRPDNAPPGSSQRCLAGCDFEPACPYSARKLYVERHDWDEDVWPAADYPHPPDAARRVEELAGGHGHGVCVWRHEHRAPDHQNVVVRFADGVTATHDLFCAAARSTRTIHVAGTAGEVEGELAAGRLVVRTFDPGQPGLIDEEEVELYSMDTTDGRFASAGIGGGLSAGDVGLLEDFISTVRNEGSGQATGRVEDSLAGYEIAFAALAAAAERRVVDVEGNTVST